MTTHASAMRNWTPAELDELIVEEEFRLRGLETTRLDTFIDAAFAFVLTLLVISFDDIPSNRDELMQAVRSVPAFGASFAVLMAFWISHRTWSRRYGLENPNTLRLSLTLIFIVLVYVYPLRAIFEAMFAGLSNNYLPTSFGISDYLTLRTLFVTYSVGFLLMSLTMRQLYAAALHAATALGLDRDENHRTRLDITSWNFSICFALLSIAIAVFTPDGPWIPLAGYIYFLMLLTRPMTLAWIGRRWQRTAAKQRAEATRSDSDR